jgi:hypothetical protein
VETDTFLGFVRPLGGLSLYSEQNDPLETERNLATLERSKMKTAAARAAAVDGYVAFNGQVTILLIT